MKNYIKLSLFTLFLMANNFISPLEPFHQEHNQRLVTNPDEDFKTLQEKKRAFEERNIGNLKSIRHTPEKKTIDLNSHIDLLKTAFSKPYNNIKKTYNRYFNTDHKNIDRAFDTNEVPTLTETDKASFEKLSSKEKLEFMNEWKERQKSLKDKENGRLQSRKISIHKQYEPQITELTEKISKLTKQQEDLQKNPNWFTKWRHDVKNDNVTSKLKEISTELEKTKQNLNTIREQRTKDIKQLYDKQTQLNTKYFTEKLDQFVDAFNPLLASENVVIRYNRTTKKMELHHSNIPIEKPEDRTAAAQSFNDFWQRVGRSDFTGPTHEAVNQAARAKALDALEADFTRLVDTEKTKIADKFPQRDITPEEQSQRDAITNEMQKELEKIRADLISKEINPKVAQDTATRAIEQAEEKAQEAIARKEKEEQETEKQKGAQKIARDENQRKAIEKSKIEFKNKATTIINNIEFKNKATTIINNLESALDNMFTSDRQKMDYVIDMQKEDQDFIHDIVESNDPDLQKLKAKIMALEPKMTRLEKIESSSNNADSNLDPLLAIFEKQVDLSPRPQSQRETVTKNNRTNEPQPSMSMDPATREALIKAGIIQE